MRNPIAQLNELGWQWRSNGVELWVRVDDRLLRVFVPLTRVWLTFSDELGAAGCPMEPAVGACYTVGGFFKRLKRAVKRGGRRARRAVRRATRKVKRTAKRYGSKALRAARSRYVRGGLAAASFAVPALAPAAAGLEAAHRALQHYEDGRRAAERIKRRLRRPGDAARVARAIAIRRGTRGIIRRARSGDRRALQWMGAFRSLQA